MARSAAAAPGRSIEKPKRSGTTGFASSSSTAGAGWLAIQNSSWRATGSRAPQRWRLTSIVPPRASCAALNEEVRLKRPGRISRFGPRAARTNRPSGGQKA